MAERINSTFICKDTNEIPRVPTSNPLSNEKEYTSYLTGIIAAKKLPKCHRVHFFINVSGRFLRRLRNSQDEEHKTTKRRRKIQNKGSIVSPMFLTRKKRIGNLTHEIIDKISFVATSHGLNLQFRNTYNRCKHVCHNS